MFNLWKIEKLEKELGISNNSSYTCRPIVHDRINKKEYLKKLKEIKDYKFPDYIKFPGVCRFNVLDINLDKIKKEIEVENKYRESLYNQVLDFIEDNSKLSLINCELFERCEKKFVLSIISLVNYFIDEKLPRSFRYEYYNLQDHKYYTNNYLLDSMEVTEDMIQDTINRHKDFLILTKRPDHLICSSTSEYCCEVFLLLKKSEFNIPDTIKLYNTEFKNYIEEYNVIKIGNDVFSYSYTDLEGNFDSDTKKSLDDYINLAINKWKT